MFADYSALAAHDPARRPASFGPAVTVAAKSGALMGLVRNEAGVVTYPDQRQYAVAVFTRSTPDTVTDPTRPGSTPVSAGSPMS
ncbi:serine hydrolase [Actinomycetes bacterium KLBMP 9797]